MSVGFEFATAARILFGAGRVAGLPAVTAGLGSRALVCTGSDPDRHAGPIASLGLPTAVLAVRGEPSVATVRDGVAAARAHRADVVVAIGGGSVLDLAKAVAALAATGADPLDHLEVVGRGRPVTGPTLPFIAVPTTAGTGSEVTANAVLAVPERGVKASLRSPLMLARVALVDPALTVGCPPAVTAASGLDALTQCLEPFVSGQANPLTDGFAREGLRRAAGALRRAYTVGDDLTARTDLALCALLGGLALANARLGAVHGLAGVVGGTVAVPHGAACAALLAPVIEANVRALRDRAPDSPAVERYAEIARLLTGRPDATVADGVAWIRATVAALGIPGLGSYGLRPRDVAGIAARAATASSTRGNPVPLTDAELGAALAAAC